VLESKSARSTLRQSLDARIGAAAEEWSQASDAEVAARQSNQRPGHPTPQTARSNAPGIGSQS